MQVKVSWDGNESNRSIRYVLTSASLSTGVSGEKTPKLNHMEEEVEEEEEEENED